MSMPLSIDSLGSSLVSGFADDGSLSSQDRSSLLGDFQSNGPATTNEAVSVLKSLGANTDVLQPDLPISTADAFDRDNTRAQAAKKLGAAPADFDVTDVGVALVNKKGSVDSAIALTIGMRAEGVKPTDKVYTDGMAELRAIAGRDLTKTELRDLDHFLTSYGYVQGDGPDKPADDNYLKRVGRAVTAEGRAVGMGAATVAYSALKGVSQATNVDLVKAVSGGKETALGANTSKASVSEAWQGLKGVFAGLKDVK